MKCDCGFTYPGDPPEGSADDIEHRWLWHLPWLEMTRPDALKFIVVLDSEEA